MNKLKQFFSIKNINNNKKNALMFNNLLYNTLPVK